MKGIVDEGDWTGGIINWKKEVTSKHGPDVTFKKRKLPGVSGKTDTYATNSEGKVVGVYQHHNDMGRVLSETDAIKGADGKRCWKGKRYAGTENGKDKCVPVKEEQIDELSPETMLKYRKKADDDANYADATGDDARFDKRVKGVMSANRLLRNKKTTEAANPVQAIKEFADDEKSEQPRREHPITIYIYSILHNKTITIVGEKLKRIPYGSYDQVHVEFTVPTSGETRTMWMPVTDKKYPTGTLSDNVYLSSSQKHNNTVTDGIFNYWAYEPNVNEGVIVGHDANDPEVAILGGAGTMSLSRLKKKAHAEALQLADDIANSKYSASSYNMKQLHNTLNTIVAAEKEMEQLYFGEAREMSPALRAAQKNLVDLSTGEVRRREEAKKKAAQAQKAASKELARLNKPKKPTLDQIWQKIEHAISNYFPDGDPTDYLGPYMERNNLSWDDITRAAKKNGYKDLWDYWNTLAQDIENDAYYDWHATGGKNVRQRAPFMETPTDPVGTQPGGWRRTDMEEAKKSEFRQQSEQQQLEKLEKIASSSLPHWAKEYLTLLNDPKGKVFKAAYYSFPKGQAAREEAAQYIMNKYKVPQHMIDKVNHGEMAHVAMDRPEDRNYDFDVPSVHEDTSFGTGMGQGGNAGESYRKFKPKSAGTCKESSIMKGLKRESE